MTAMLLAWGLPLDLLARGALREGDNRTGELVFTAPNMLGRLLAVRLVVPMALMFALCLPGMLRLLGSDPMSALAGPEPRPFGRDTSTRCFRPIRVSARCTCSCNDLL